MGYPFLPSLPPSLPPSFPSLFLSLSLAGDPSTFLGIPEQLLRHVPDSPFLGILIGIGEGGGDGSSFKILQDSLRFFSRRSSDDFFLSSSLPPVQRFFGSIKSVWVSAGFLED